MWLKKGSEVYPVISTRLSIRWEVGAGQLGCDERDPLRLVALEREQNRLLHYISLLNV